MTHVCYVCDMKKLFEKRARVVVYVEQAELDRMMVEAKAEGKTVPEWARERLRAAKVDSAELLPANWGNPEPEKISKTGVDVEPGVGERRGTKRGRGVLRTVEDVANTAIRKSGLVCGHGAAPGFCKKSGCKNHRGY